MEHKEFVSELRRDWRYRFWEVVLCVAAAEPAVMAPAGEAAARAYQSWQHLETVI